jgi:hypothetical protein
MNSARGPFGNGPARCSCRRPNGTATRARSALGTRKTFLYRESNPNAILISGSRVTVAPTPLS